MTAIEKRLTSLESQAARLRDRARPEYHFDRLSEAQLDRIEELMGWHPEPEFNPRDPATLSEAERAELDELFALLTDDPQTEISR